MSLTLAVTTELEAVNMMLDVIGEQPVNQIDNTGITEADTARRLLHQTSREIQSIGLNCNTDENYRFSPDSDGYIVIPQTVLQVDASDPNRNVAQRGTKLYDKDNNTFIFSEAIELDMVTFLSFEDLPQTVKDYLTIKAARRYAKRVLGSDVIDGLTESDEYEAKLTFNAAEVDKGDYTIFDAGDSVSQAVHRGFTY